MTKELDLFENYAAAFEEAYDSGDWSNVAALFDEDITWAVAGLPVGLGYQGKGRSNTSEAIKFIVDGFDRRFDGRLPEVREGPDIIPSGVHLSFSVTYQRAGIPPLVLSGEEWDVFIDDKLAMHFELIHNGQEVLEYLTKNAPALIPIA